MFYPLLATAVTAVLVIGAELLHFRRVRRLRHLAFGPDGRFSAMAMLSPILRVLSFSALVWGLVTLLTIVPKAHRAKIREVEPEERRHILLVLDVSPSMRLEDSGEGGDLTRTERTSKLVQSLLERTTDDRLHITMVAVYNGAKPVVQESRDLEVILNFLDGLPLSSVFPVGKTRLFDGLEVAFELAKSWPTDSATLILASDGDTVPASGMPKKPASIGATVVLGVGDPARGSLIDGRQSRQDVGALQQIASRLGGEYHDGNLKHIPTKMLEELGTLQTDQDGMNLTLREYAIIATIASAVILALLPVLNFFFGSPFRPGVKKST